jgi:hypothetical protein
VRKRVAKPAAKVPVAPVTKNAGRKKATTKRRAPPATKTPVTARKTTKAPKTQRR